MRSPRMSPPEISRCEAPSNSTRSSGSAKASTTRARAAHHSVSTIAVGRVTVLSNGVSLNVLAQCFGVHESDRPHLPWIRTRTATHSSSDDRQNQFGQHCVSDAPLLLTRPVIVTGVHGHDEVECGHQKQALTAPTGAGNQAFSTYRSANGDVAQEPMPAVAEGVFYGD